jgi:hypothetical protein
MPETLHLVGTVAGGLVPDHNLWHTIRFIDGIWLRFGDVEAQTGDQGFFQDVDCAQNRLDLHVCGVTMDLSLWHTVRRIDGSWVAFGDVEDQAGDGGNITNVACTSTYNSSQPYDLAYELQVLAANTAGRLWHTIRRGDGSWTQFDDVKAQAGDPGPFRGVACDADPLGDHIHVLAVGQNGGLWHTIRRADGSWVAFGDVKAQAGDRGSFTHVAVATRPTNFPEGVPQEYETHVCGVTSDDRLWHAIRRNNGSWTQFGDVEAQAGNRGGFSSVDCAIADTGDERGVLHVAGVAGGAGSRLWHTIRRNNGSWTQFGDVEAQAGGPKLFFQPSLARVIL